MTHNMLSDGFVSSKTRRVPDSNGVCTHLKLDTFASQLVSGSVDAAHEMLSRFYEQLSSSEI